LISAAVLAESVDYGESDVRCSRVLGPCAEGELRLVGRKERHQVIALQSDNENLFVVSLRQPDLF